MAQKRTGHEAQGRSKRQAPIAALADTSLAEKEKGLQVRKLTALNSETQRQPSATQQADAESHVYSFLAAFAYYSYGVASCEGCSISKLSFYSQLDSVTG